MTTTLRAAADEFLSQKVIAVAGVSRDPKQPANLIYRRLRDSGHEVYAVNPNATEVEGAHCWPDVGSLPEVPDGVVVATTCAFVLLRIFTPDLTSSLARALRHVGRCGSCCHPLAGAPSENGYTRCSECGAA